MTRQQAAALRQLPPCKGSLQQQVHGAEQRCPSWGLTKLQRSHYQQHQLQQDVFGSGLAGQAVLTLPLKSVDVSVALPPGLQLAATPAGHLDCRLQLLGAHMDWPATGAAAHNTEPRVLPARSSAAGFACRSGALLLAHALFPEHTQHLLAWIAVPVAVADSVGVLAAATPQATQQAARSRVQGLKGRLQRQRGPGDGVGWLDGVTGVVAGSLHTFRSLSGPAAALATGSWLWGLVSPSSHVVCSAVVALMAVAADYNRLGRDVAKGRIPPGKAVEAAWRARHKAAAQRLAVYCSDLPAKPPLAPVIHLAGFCSIAAGAAFGGQGLCGQLPAALADPTSLALQPTHWPVGRAQRSRGGDGMQLVVSGSVAGRGAAEVHEAAGLSRTQLLELFTGTTADPTAAAAEAPPAAAAVEEGSAGIEAPAVPGVDPAAMSVPTPAGPPMQTGQAAAAVVPAPDLDAALRVSTDSGSEKSVDAVIRIKQPACRDKPDKGRTSSSRDTGRAAGAPGISRTASNASSSSNTGAAMAGRAGPAPAAAPLPEAAASSAADPLAFLDSLPLYGQQDHAHLVAAEAAAAAGEGAGNSSLAVAVAQAGNSRQQGVLLEGLQLVLRGVYLLLVFAPFLLLGAPMLLLSWWLLTRAAAAQHHTVTPRKPQMDADSDAPVASTAAEELADGHNSTHSSRVQSLGARVRHALLQHPQQLGLQLLQRLWRLLLALFALVDLVLVLALGGHWAAGISAWESAGMWLRRQAWVLLHFSCSHAGAAFIKWGQWSSSRRDIFPSDFCDALSTFHDRAPVHSYRHTRRAIRAALGVDVEQLFDQFDPQPLASGSIAQVHKAILRPAAYRRYLQHRQQQEGLAPTQHPSQQQQDEDDDEEVQSVVVKVCHPNVAEHIRLDFKLVGWLSAAASQLPLLRGLPLRESVAQFSHTMTAQTDLRVEAVHALRFYNNFAGVSSVTIPRPIPGLVSSTVLVESFEAGQSVAVFMREPAAINTQIVALGVDAYLKMLLTDNFVHTDLHPGNILFTSRPLTQAGRRRQQQREQQRQQGQPLWRRLLGGRRAAQPASAAREHLEDTSAGADGQVVDEMPQWERELLQLSAQHQQRWTRQHGPLPAATQPGNDGSSAGAPQQAADAAAAAAGSGEPQAAQLVLLDFGLAECLTATVRHHFISFLNAISAGDGLAAAHHLLRWSGNQTCPDVRGFKSDMVDLFQAACDIHSPQGIDLDAVMQAVLGLARQHSVAIDSCYASLVISVCVLVGFGKALDPEVNLMDAATPTLLAYALTGKAVGRLYS